MLSGLLFRWVRVDISCHKLSELWQNHSDLEWSNNMFKKQQTCANLVIDAMKPKSTW